MRWRIPLVVAVALFVAVSCDQQPVEPEVGQVEDGLSLKVTLQDKYFMEFDQPNACTGELHHLSGYLHMLEAVTEDAAGGLHIKAHYQPLGWKAVGNDSGIVCVMNGKTGWTDNYGPGDLPYSGTYVNRYHMVCPGPGNDLVVFDTWHVTINAAGQITAEVDKTRTECAG